MSKRNKAMENQPERQNRPTNKADVLGAQFQNQLITSESPGDLVEQTNDNPHYGQSTYFNDARFSAVQRQALATQISRINGNQHLQKIIPRTSLSIQRDWLGDIGDAIGSAADTVGDWIDDVDTKSRNLSKGEIAKAREIFGDTIDYSQVSLERNSLYNAGSPRTVGNTIALTDNRFDGKNLKLNSHGQNTLIHELAHVWQYQNQGWEYALEALWAQAIAAIKTGSRNAAYDWPFGHFHQLIYLSGNIFSI